MTRSVARWLGPIGLGLALGACATFTNPVSQSTVYNLENAYGVAQAAADAYTKLPRCAAGEASSLADPCSDHGVIVQLAKADANARAALTNAETFVRTKPTLSPTDVISEAESAVALFQQIETNYGVH